MNSECANPLLLQWVGEWLDHARHHSSKGVTTYKNAYESLKACPIKFKHPSEAKQLKGLGDKLCARLTDKMTQHCQSNGTVMPEMPHKRRRAQGAADGNDDGNESDEALAPKKARKQKPYVPKLRSGAYAIMMALSTIYEEQPRGISKQELIELAEDHCDSSFTITDPTHGKFYTAWNSMKTLQEKDLVFETGKKGSVRKYGLTDEGWETVVRIKSTLNPGQQTLNKPSRSKPTGARAPSSRNRNHEDDMESEMEAAPQRPPNSYLRDDDNFLENQRGLQPAISRPRNPYLRDDDGFNENQQGAPRRQPNPYLRDDDNFVENQRGLEPVISKPQRKKNPRNDNGRTLGSGNSRRQNSLELSDDDVFLEPVPQRQPNPFLRPDDNFHENQRGLEPLISRPRNPYLRDDDNFLENQRGLEPVISNSRLPKNARKDDGVPEPRSKPATLSRETLGYKVSKPRGQHNPIQIEDDDFSDKDARGPTVSKSLVSAASQFLRHDDGFHETSSRPQRTTVASSRNQSMTAPPQNANDASGSNTSDGTSFPPFAPIKLQPSSFSVHLVLDNREIRTKKDRDYIEEELLKSGIKVLKRSLPVGDALWVAKCHDPNYLPKFGAEGDEVLLDHIVERKRLDDLISSIMDKRYDEQKFRLSKSGVKNVSYIIEEITLTEEHFKHHEQRVESAMASMQVVNGFFVKKTTGIDHTIRYLAKMTRLLKTMYEEKCLLVIPPDTISPDNYTNLRAHLSKEDPVSNYQITYPSFAAISSKSDTLTLRDVFLKMLMCTKGITSEKAVEIQKRWKTPYALVQAFKELGEGKEAAKRKREFIAKSLDHVVSRKKVPKAVSMRVAAVWGDVDEV